VPRFGDLPNTPMLLPCSSVGQFRSSATLAHEAVTLRVVHYGRSWRLGTQKFYSREVLRISTSISYIMAQLRGPWFLALPICILAAACTAGTGGTSSGGINFGADGGLEEEDSGGVAVDGGVITKDSGARTDGSATDSAPPADPAGETNLTFSGACAPDFRDLIVSTNVSSYDSLAVVNANAPLSGSFQIQLVSSKRQLALTTTNRTKDKDVININAGGVVYTNLCNSSAAGGCTYDAATQTWKNDPIAGSVSVTAYDPRNGKLDVTLTGVVLQSSQGAGLCRVSGTVKAKRLGR
jgi:hypothetical protein